MTAILGINAYHPDASACILIDGKLVAAVEEERFTRIKHWAGFPVLSIRYCLQAAGLRPKDIEHIAVNRNPLANLGSKVFYALRHLPPPGRLFDRLNNSGKINSIKAILDAEFKLDDGQWNPSIHNVEHHCAHLASAFYPSPFEKAAVISVDGFGDFVSTMWAEGRGSDLIVKGKVLFPHSLGLLYLAVTQFLGFHNYGDEFKVMALSAFDEDGFDDRLAKLIQPGTNGGFRLNLEYFIHHRLGFSMNWQDGHPVITPVFSKLFENTFGRSRKAGEPILPRHKAMAAGLQAVYEQRLDELLLKLHHSSGCRVLCLAGGCGQNSVANGKLHVKGPFEQVWVPPASTDAGGAVGAALWVWHKVLGNEDRDVMEHAYWGPEYGPEEIGGVVAEYHTLLEKSGCRISFFNSKETLCRRSASLIAGGKVLGWFQGRQEFGPRALGNRSIICDPRNSEIPSILNSKVKKRESFRPFAATVLKHATGRWYSHPVETPFMTHVLRIRSDRIAKLAAVGHVDGSGRVQTLEKKQNPLFYQLIASFERLTGLPLVLNTSMNENEPIVTTPQEAIDCFLRTEMDCLAIGDYLLERVA